MDTTQLMDLLRQPLWQYYISALFVIVPVIRIFRRAGVNPMPAAFLVVPYVGYIFCAASLVLLKWPHAPEKVKKPKEAKA